MLWPFVFVLSVWCASFGLSVVLTVCGEFRALCCRSPSLFPVVSERWALLHFLFGLILRGSCSLSSLSLPVWSVLFFLGLCAVVFRFFWCVLRLIAGFSPHVLKVRLQICVLLLCCLAFAFRMLALALLASWVLDTCAAFSCLRPCLCRSARILSF